MSSPKRHAALAVSPTITAAVGPDEPVLDVDDIQGNILAGFNKDYQSVAVRFSSGRESELRHIVGD